MLFGYNDPLPLQLIPSANTISYWLISIVYVIGHISYLAPAFIITKQKQHSNVLKISSVHLTFDEFRHCAHIQRAITRKYTNIIFIEKLTTPANDFSILFEAVFDSLWILNTNFKRIHIRFDVIFLEIFLMKPTFSIRFD